MQKLSGGEDFVHPVLNEEVRTISGRYMLGKEKRLFFRGREVLYHLIIHKGTLAILTANYLWAEIKLLPAGHTVFSRAESPEEKICPCKSV
jgi:hypothetical protein